MTDSSNPIGALASGLAATALSRLPVGIAANTAATTPAQAKLAKAAHDFEAIFMRQMLAAADKADYGNTLFTGDGLSTFRTMQEARFADIAAGRGTLGIAKMLERQIGAKLGHAASGLPGAATATGGAPATTGASGG